MFRGLIRHISVDIDGCGKSFWYMSTFSIKESKKARPIALYRTGSTYLTQQHNHCFSSELKELATTKKRFYDFTIVYNPQTQNWTVNLVAKTICAFHMNLFFFGCSTMA
ncbi:hypothetical protein IGI04_023295 [Brassica rapa subsp. trilocularis]|uniref:Uncharacterized protein n=1 Tax=Brassica rapa subsp. trilocularis TaxID=1813537 RepID=A0ABQ7M3E7_BRACM|nr:hypothetical protein IGI04_023295 [Brassica rapa subsp. trilocularis]